MSVIVGKVDFQVNTRGSKNLHRCFLNNGSSSSSHSAGLKCSPKNHSVRPSAVCQNSCQHCIVGTDTS